MEWRDRAYVLSARRHGESAAIVELLTGERGRHAGIVRGGQSPKARAVLQTGNEVAATWRARLPEHLGTYACELVLAHAARHLGDPGRLAALASAAAILAAVLPEREPHADVFEGFGALVAALDPRPGRLEPDWPARYVCWERDLLAALGFGLDLTRCAATGSTTDLAYVSPRTGRAVSREAGEPYRERLLGLPGFLWRQAPAEGDDLAQGLALTGYFLERHLLGPQGRALPRVRRGLSGRMPPGRAPASAGPGAC